MIIMNSNNVLNKYRYENEQISILLEYYRMELIQSIYEIMKSKLELLKNISLNASKLRKLSMLLSTWIMEQFDMVIDSDKIIKDPLIPYNASKFEQLKKNLLNLEFGKTIEEVDEIINYWNLTENCNLALDSINVFLSSDFYKSNKNKMILIYGKEQDDNQLIRIKIPDVIKNYFKYPKPCKWLLTKSKYHQLQDGDLIKRNINSKELLGCLLIRYHTLDSENQQLAINPDFYKSLVMMNYNICMELFASSLNNYFPRYGSIFYDLEKYYGSSGYFNGIEISESGIYVANPPFDEDIMKNMMEKIIVALPNETKDLSFIITIPQWGEYAEFTPYELIKESDYLVYQEIIAKKRAKFLNYSKNNYIYPCNIHLLVLQNMASKLKYPNLGKDIELSSKLYFI
jgi:hypothetical protein